MSLKKGTVQVIFVLFLSQKTYFTFSYVSCNQSFKPISSGQLYHIHTESVLKRKNTRKNMIFILAFRSISLSLKCKYCRHSSMHLITLDYQNITVFCVIGQFGLQMVILFEWLYGTGWKFWLKNTCEKVKSDFYNINLTKIEKVPFFLETPCRINGDKMWRRRPTGWI